jgi:GDPmannose 4,6-dehydratase
MWLMLQQDKAEDFVIATGKTFTLQDFIRLAFAEVGLDWTEYVTHADEFMRPTDILVSSADPSKALAKLDWKAEIDMPNVVKLMMRS